MFERKTTPDEHVIDQGDDGDNFYVIDRGIFDIYVKIDGSDKKVCLFVSMIREFSTMWLSYHIL